MRQFVSNMGRKPEARRDEFWVVTSGPGRVTYFDIGGGGGGGEGEVRWALVASKSEREARAFATKHGVMAVRHSPAGFADLLMQHLMDPHSPNQTSLALLHPTNPGSGTLVWLRRLMPEQAFDSCRLLFDQIHSGAAPDGQNRVEMSGVPPVEIYKAVLDRLLANLDLAVEEASGPAK